ncbi:SDR family oxidoreductase [Stutzerimonas zhaodongensis]|uniref:SDR family oxidoreductase n=1 Tax=Stutzerimonas zhaodongensis TaxID=1176257 RepID=A0A3M2I1E9_9GAMM|nr:SDR family oxidoreductase [Stutzerimonas zhaodongensis]MCQ4314766.1 SDR family oxidoreductase [Stutzerimonas zhaodongensis]RMH92267.1 SDR family oxidoreductase [Stutzerimonas zhaodongensis]
MRILVTGASGFLASALLPGLKQQGHDVVATTRSSVSARVDGVDYHLGGDLSEAQDWHLPLQDVEVVVHTAARVHVMDESSDDPLQAFRRINVFATLDLARQAAEAGVSRFVFISSIKVSGEQTRLGMPFRPDDVPRPADPYGVSKREAEDGLLALAAESGMEVVIVRPPLVYGPGVKGNFASMIELLDKGVPLPLGAVYNKRSLVGIGNLVDLIILCLDHSAAANQVFFVSDDEDLSTTEMLRCVAEAMGKPVRLVRVPASMLQIGATLLGKKAMAQRLLGSLQVDITKTRGLLGWTPPYTVEEGLRYCFESFKPSVGR